MPAPRVVRPPQEFFSSDRHEELRLYLRDHWERALRAREDQVDNSYRDWQRDYEGRPAQSERVTPWPGASNFVVQVIRMFVDTFVARTLNIIFATRPLYTLSFLPEEVRGSTEMYVNRKALYDWQHYKMAHKLLHRGAKNGTCVVKTPYEVMEEIDVQDEGVEQTITTYDGPRSTPISFEDFYVYPITIEELKDATILFHRLRFVEEEAVLRSEKWPVSEEDVRGSCTMPTDVKRNQEQEDAGVSDSRLRELHLIECHLKFPITNDSSKLYNLIVLFEPQRSMIFDVYYNPYPRNLNIFQDYRPFPREDLFYGDSWCRILAQAQEEASCIHNDRRNASYLSNAPIFKRRADSLLPNPSTVWYPGKVWDLQDMSDLEFISLHHSYSDMLAEENHILMLSERTMGLSGMQQAPAVGGGGKRGIYNAQGTLAVLSEGNQRQDTNIRDAREVLGAIGKIAFTLQRTFGANDPIIDMFPRVIAAQIREGLAVSQDVLANNYFEIKPSDAGANAEVAKANVLQLAQVVGQYGAALPQMATQIMANKNPVLQGLFMEAARMQHWMAQRIMRAFGEYDGAEQLPELAEAFAGGGNQARTPQPTPPSTASNAGALPQGGTGIPGVGSLREGMAGIAQVSNGFPRGAQ